MSAPADPLETLHATIDRAVAPLVATHRGRLQCRLGCTDCCVDDLTVFEVEADLIRARYAALLAEGTAHPEGACAFLGARGECRIYAHRPYVCRTQGLPLRWLESSEAADDPTGSRPTSVERRSICPLNARGQPIEELPAEVCWTIGPAEERLALLQRVRHGSGRRVALRDLFRRCSSRRRS